MTGGNNGRVEQAADAVVEPEVAVRPLVDAVRHAALDLLASLPEHPERLRVQAGGVTVDLDWRTPAPPVTALPMTGAAAPAVPLDPALGRPAERAPGEPPEPPAAERRPDLHHVCAPTVGTFYHAPEPGAAPFVTVGAVVSAGQQVGIVEAMKLMLPVEADRTGTVVEVLVHNGQPVEYGQQLLALGPVG